MSNAGTLSLLLLHRCPYEGRAPKCPCHDTIGLLLILLVSLFLFGKSATHVVTKVSSGKQSSCGGGPPENAATFESSSSPPRSSRTTFRKDSTNSTGCRADANPFLTCTHLSASVPDARSRHARDDQRKCHPSFSPHRLPRALRVVPRLVGRTQCVIL